jgi:hypothetical protein
MVPRGGVPVGAEPGWRAEDRLGDEDPEFLERFACRIAGIAYGADHIDPLGAG